MEYLYDQKTKNWRLGTTEIDFQVTTQEFYEKVKKDYEDLKNPKTRNTRFIRCKAHYPGLPSCKYKYFNIEDYAFTIDEKYCFRYTTPSCTSTSFIKPEDIYGIKKLSKYFAENENYEKTAYYVKNLETDIIWTFQGDQERYRKIQNYIYFINNISSNLRLLLELNNIINYEIYKGNSNEKKR